MVDIKRSAVAELRSSGQLEGVVYNVAPVDLGKGLEIKGKDQHGST